jgi:hypothetical protein
VYSESIARRGIAIAIAITKYSIKKARIAIAIMIAGGWWAYTAGVQACMRHEGCMMNGRVKMQVESM